MNSLDSGDLRRDYTRFAAPTMLALFIYSVYSMVDGVFVGHLVGPEALAAVNIGAPFLNVLFAAAVLLGIGASTMISRLQGEGRQERARQVFTLTVAAALLLGAAVTVLAHALLGPLCRLLGAAADTEAYAREYVGGLASFAAAVLVEYNLEVLTKAEGRPRLAAVTVVTACTVHAALDWLFIGRLGLGVKGAAWATGVAETVAVLIFLSHYLFSPKRTLRFVRFRFELKTLLGLVKRGLPDATTELSVGVFVWMYNLVILRLLGTEGVTCFTVVTYVNTLMSYTLLGASQGMQPLVSYHRGAGDRASCKRLFHYAEATQAATAILCVVLLQVFAEPVAGLFLGEEAASMRAFAASSLRQFSFSFLLMGFNVVAAGYLTACERPIPALGLSVGRGCAVQALTLFAFSALFGAAGIWWAALAAEAVVTALSPLLLKREL